MNEKNHFPTIEVYTADSYLFQKIRLAAPEGAMVVMGESEAENAIRLIDVDSVNFMPSGEYITLSRTEENADIKIPFSLEIIDTLLTESESEPPLKLIPGERSVYLNGEKIRLTEVEYSLMSELFSAGGEYRSREELLSRVWGNDTDPGVLNVYVHYLREKLERGGEKIILSSRKCGYRISEKYAMRGESRYVKNN